VPDPDASPALWAARGTRDRGPAACVSDSKLIGRILLSTAPVPGTWWYLTREGLKEAGITNYLAAIEEFFGRTFASEADAVEFLVAQLDALDANGNGYVCAYRLRGTKTSIGDPNFAYYLFQVRDDKHADK
jgi:hypothetical protein